PVRPGHVATERRGEPLHTELHAWRPACVVRTACRGGAESVRLWRAARLLMSDAVTPGTSPPPSPGGVVTGFYIKLPARGEFVRAGVPRDFAAPWDAWLQSVIAGSRTLMGDAWLPAFLEAPVWCFPLP